MTTDRDNNILSTIQPVKTILRDTVWILSKNSGSLGPMFTILVELTELQNIINLFSNEKDCNCSQKQLSNPKIRLT